MSHHASYCHKIHMAFECEYSILKYFFCKIVVVAFLTLPNFMNDYLTYMQIIS